MSNTEPLWRGMRAARAGRIEEARSAFQAVLHEDPTNRTALTWLGYLADDPLDSIAYTTEAVKSHPQDQRATAALQWAWQRTFSHLNTTGDKQARRRSKRRWVTYQLGMATCVMCLIASTLVGWTMAPAGDAQAAAAVSVANTPHPADGSVEEPELTVTSTARPTVPSPPAEEQVEATSMPTPTPTPTTHPTPVPTEPPVPPEMIVPSPFPTIEPEVLAEVSTPLTVPTPVPPVPVAEDAINIVVLGSDQRPDWSEWHTDVVQIVSIQRRSGTVSVISVPRDIYLYIPGFWMSRINFADYYGDAYGYEGGGPALVRDTLAYNLGLRIDYYVRTNFDGLIGIVDTVGGIDVPVHCRLSDHWPYPDENGEYPILTLEPGIHHLDGETALWYARSRLTTSVFSRERRQQQVLQSIWHQAKDVGMLTQVPALWKQGQEMIQTDLSFTEILDLAQLALRIEDQNVRFYNIDSRMLTPWTTPYGGHVYLPQWENIQPMLEEAMAPPPGTRLGRTYMPVEIWNGTPNQDWEWLVADRVYRAGFPATIGEPDHQEYAETQLIIFSQKLKGSGAAHLQQVFQIPDAQVVHQPDSSAGHGFRLIIGADYLTCP